MTYDERQYSQLGPPDPGPWVLRRRPWVIYREWGEFPEGGARTGYCNTWDTLKMAAHSQRLQLFAIVDTEIAHFQRHGAADSPSAERVNVSSMSSTRIISPASPLRYPLVARTFKLSIDLSHAIGKLRSPNRRLKAHCFHLLRPYVHFSFILVLTTLTLPHNGEQGWAHWAGLTFSGISTR